MYRFTFTGASMNGYYCINDSYNSDMPIWIDCPKEFIETIVDALNKNFDKEAYARANRT